MIERSLDEFTELDNDYITLWSQLIMSKEDIVENYIEK